MRYDTPDLALNWYTPALAPGLAVTCGFSPVLSAVATNAPPATNRLLSQLSKISFYSTHQLQRHMNVCVCGGGGEEGIAHLSKG